VSGSALIGAAVGTMAGLLAAVFTYELRIAPAERLTWSWATLGRSLPSVVAAVLGAVPLSLLVDQVLSGVVAHLVYGVLLVLLSPRSPGPRCGAGSRDPCTSRRVRRTGAALAAAALYSLGAGSPA